MNSEITLRLASNCIEKLEEKRIRKFIRYSEEQMTYQDRGKKRIQAKPPLPTPPSAYRDKRIFQEVKLRCEDEEGATDPQDEEEGGPSERLAREKLPKETEDSDGYTFC